MVEVAIAVGIFNEKLSMQGLIGILIIIIGIVLVGKKEIIIPEEIYNMS